MAKKPPFRWGKSPACVATYDALAAGGHIDVPFAKAGSVALKSLRYFPKTTANANMIDVVAMETARQLLKHVTRDGSAIKESAKDSSARILERIAAVLSNGSMTVRNVAAVVDANVRFANEAGNK